MILDSLMIKLLTSLFLLHRTLEWVGKVIMLITTYTWNQETAKLVGDLV